MLVSQGPTLWDSHASSLVCFTQLLQQLLQQLTQTEGLWGAFLGLPGQRHLGPVRLRGPRGHGVNLVCLSIWPRRIVHSSLQRCAHSLLVSYVVMRFNISILFAPAPLSLGLLSFSGHSRRHPEAPGGTPIVRAQRQVPEFNEVLKSDRVANF